MPPIQCLSYFDGVHNNLPLRVRSLSRDQSFEIASSIFKSTLATAVWAARSTTSSDLLRAASPWLTNSSAAAGDWRNRSVYFSRLASQHGKFARPSARGSSPGGTRT